MFDLPLRPRRNRKSAAIRNLVQETHLNPGQLVLPLFVCDGDNKNIPIHSLKGSSRMSIDILLKEIESSIALGIHNFMLFPVVDESLKDSFATYSYSERNFYLKAAKEIKSKFPECTLISDVAMDPYSSDGHDGYVKDGKILNDESIEILTKMSISQAEAGFDMIGPSDMMDGRVGAIRMALDKAGFTETSIMSYTAKYASAMYGPFRDALDSAPKFGDKKTYQMNPANSKEALLEAELDIAEGADFIMVKPALHYLDVIKTLNDHFSTPVACYHVSGECAMLTAACDNGWLDFEKAMPETLLSMKRAGASVIITYFAKDFARWYNQ